MKSLLIVLLCVFLLSRTSIAQQAPSSYFCNVANCQVCSYPGFCGLCNNNYILQINMTTSTPYCQQVTCSLSNCQTCYQNNMCSVCSSGYYVASNGTCIQGTNPNTCTPGCLSCNSTACQLCNFGYNLQNGACFPNNGMSTNLANCQSAFTGFTCQLCKATYMVNIAYQCVSNPAFVCNSVDNCAQCTQSGTTITCTACQSGFQLNAGACVTQSCNIQNCQTCNGQACQTCLNGYILSDSQCVQMIYPCNVANCVLCTSSNICAQCAPGYSAVTNMQSSVVVGSSCVQITASVGGNIPVTNCNTYGPMIPGTSSLQIGCITCQQNFTNVGGYCVANISLANFTCEIQNCAYCVQSNICGQCAPGYTAFLGNLNQCVKNYSPIPNCLLTPILAPICSLCTSGYVLVNTQCVQVPSSTVTCNLTGCTYCITNNTCAACQNGYTLATGACTATCTVQNCYQCSGTNCQTCSFGFYLSNNQCLNASNQPLTYCNSQFGNTCSQCTYYMCTQCTSGNSLNPNTGLCCPTPAYNWANCASYSTVWATTGCTATFTCSACSLGAFLMTPFTGGQVQCVKLPCDIANCSYCFQGNFCGVCNSGYTLVNNTCTAYTVPSTCTVANCISCNSNNQCTGCLNGYILYNGSCVCNYQNCLACQGSSFCTVCAFPTIATFTSSAGCLPQVVSQTLCNVTNCLNCMNVGFCAQCYNGYSLQSNGTCSLNPCNLVNNCSLCSLDQSICYACKPGYLPYSPMSYYCVQVAANYSCQVLGCAVCQPNNPSKCQTCSPFNSLTNSGVCDPINCVTNCIFCLSPTSCIVCQVGFILTVNSNNQTACTAGNSTVTTCPSTIANCVGCQTQVISGVSTTVCIQCTIGMQPAQNQLSCVPQTCSVPNCQICVQNQKFNNNLQLCFVCQQGYFINSYYQCSPYNPPPTTPNCSGIYNCLFCSNNNYCGLCAPGWNSTNGTCLTSSTVFCNVQNCLACTMTNTCATCAVNYQLSSTNVCIPQCNITNCLTCSNPTTCSACVGNLVLTNNACNCPDTTYTIVNNNCVCPTGTTLSAGTCVACNVTNCQTCSSTNYCANCMNNLQLTICGCNDNTFTIVNGQCVCPSGFTLSAGTCVGCNVANCQTCSSLNTCQTCMTSYVLGNNQCNCPDNTFSIVAGVCVCPSGTTLSAGTCVGCNVANCQTCSSTNNCQTCMGNLTLTNNVCGCPNSFTILGGQCVCPSGTTLSGGVCVTCSPANCQTCSSYNQCQTCVNNLQLTTCGCPDSTWSIVNGNCVCPSGTTAFGGTCVGCNVVNCQTCSSANTCQTCLGNLTLTSNTCGCPNTFTVVGGQCVCASGTTLISGACVSCNVQNCQACSAADTCQTCVGNLTLTAGVCGCPNTFTVQAGQCVCASGTTLSAGTCVSCNVVNCQTCAQANQCQTCMGNLTLANNACNCPDPSFVVTAGNCVCPAQTTLSQGTCVSCTVANCQLCSTANVCQTCVGNLTLTAGVCGCPDTFSIISGNCQCPAQTSLVQNQCVSCSIANCQTCSAAGQCSQCTGNLTLTNNVCGCPDTFTILGGSCVCASGYTLINGACVSCNPQNCQTCSSANVCQQCMGNLIFTACGCTGQFQLSGTQCVCPSGTTLSAGNCVNCNVQNCQTCAQANVCQTCTGNLTLANNACGCPDNSFTIVGGNCVCPPNFSLAQGTCISCNVQNCLTCSSANVCQTCVNNLVLTNNVCGCGSSFNLVNNQCVCPAGTTLSGGVCITCNVPNCQTCSATNVCSTCLNNLNLLANPCQCSDSTFTIVNSACVCPVNTTISTTATTCINCNIANCQSCTTANVCAACTGNLTLANNACSCPDNTFTISGGNCVCPVNTSLLGTTCISCNIQNCQTCSSANQCQTCLNNLVLTNNACACAAQQSLVNQACVPCTVQYCTTCNATNFCNQCNTGFTTTSAGLCTCPVNTTLSTNACVACNIANCVLCQQSNICSTCQTNYYLITAPNVCVLCNIANCLTCSGPNYCTSCSNNLQVNSQGNLCVSCGIQNCNLCTNSYTCATCSPGYQLTYNSRACVQCNIQGCAQCASQTTCQTCLNGYSLNSGLTCSLCVAPCATCSTNSVTTCLTCMAPFSSTPASNGTCYTCNVMNCLTCSVTNTATCTQCNLNYILTSNNQCSYNGTCSVNCAVCLFNQFCQVCNPGYTLNPTNNTQCVQCNVSNCATCSPTDLTTCFTCSAGYYLQNGVCQSCPFPNCQTCTPTNCLTYQPSTNQIAVMFNNQTYPVICDPGCTTCSSINPTSCIVCSNGYTLNANKICVPCQYPCLNCAANAPSTCLSCFGNFIVSGNTCVACASSCLTCSATNTSQCTSCYVGFSLSNGVCTAGCPEYCSQCSSSNVCTICNSGFSANPKGQCVPCVYNCRVCSGTAQGICLQCGTGFYLSSSNTCVACTQNCLNCNLQGCLTCASGYYLNSNLTCVMNCNYPCATCASNNQNSCTSCLLGFTYNSVSNTCTPISGCNSDSGVCYACPIGYINSVTSCTPCGQNSNCARCSSTNTSSCISCVSGYYLNSSTCVKCSNNCATCTSNGNCLSCVSGYTLAMQPVNSPGTCVQCQTPCTQCMGSPTTCTACIGGFTLNGWNCMSTFNYGFFISLNTTMTVFYDNYLPFLQALVAPLNSKNIQAVTVTSILPGSVNVTGFITTVQQSNSNTAGSQFYGLQNSLDTGSIAGMPIITSYVNVNGGTVPPPSSSTNLALILGICIPVGVIIIGLLIYFIFVRKNNKESHPVDYKSNNSTVRETFELTAKGQPTL